MEITHKHYVTAAATNVALTFERFGFKPPSLHDPETISKHDYYRNLQTLTKAKQEQDNAASI
jgi:hypothetical protein